jgi:ribonuclease HII
MGAAPVPHLDYETRLWDAGATRVFGLDEVGRGPLAGPVMAGAVMLEPGRTYDWAPDVRDSKALTPETRAELATAIRQDTTCGIGAASSVEIDRIGIVKATQLAMARALWIVSAEPDHLLLDAFGVPWFEAPQTPIIKGDATSVSIAAASIIAKVARDELMTRNCGRYPGYDFCHNKGYATPGHRAAIATLGPCALHRMTWHPMNPNARAPRPA